MRPIGIIASESSENEARVILNQSEEKRVKVEDLVLVDNRNEGKILAVLRKGRGINENLKAGGYNPGVAYARAGGPPSTAKETYDFTLSVIGEVKDGIIQQNKKILAPGSTVYLFEDRDDPMRYLAGTAHKHSIGYYEGHPNWRVPVNEAFIPYHIGVFASTGGGKSYLTRLQLVPLFLNAGFDVLVFDWKGRDYAPYFKKENVISISEIALDPETVVSYLCKKMGNFGYSSQQARGAVRQALEDFIYSESWRGLTVSEFRKVFYTSILQALNPHNQTSGRAFEDQQRFERGYRRLKDSDIQNILGTLTANDILQLVREREIIVIDMKKTGRDEKLSAFLTIARYLMDLMQNDEDLNLALVIDEGPQYCPFNPDGIQKETTDMIIDLCALGRSHKLCVCILSQGIAGEIGINAAVRRNLNTQFIGKIHPLDLNEAGNWLSPFNIDPKFLLSLPPGHFYFMGNMNPSPIPLLITFEVK
jgi:hypothetical protein